MPPFLQNVKGSDTSITGETWAHRKTQAHLSHSKRTKSRSSRRAPQATCAGSRPVCLAETHGVSKGGGPSAQTVLPLGPSPSHTTEDPQALLFTWVVSINATASELKTNHVEQGHKVLPLLASHMESHGLWKVHPPLLRQEMKRQHPSCEDSSDLMGPQQGLPAQSQSCCFLSESSSLERLFAHPQAGVCLEHPRRGNGHGTSQRKPTTPCLPARGP